MSAMIDEKICLDKGQYASGINTCLRDFGKCRTCKNKDLHKQSLIDVAMAKSLKAE